jgi:hypothetical protein
VWFERAASHDLLLVLLLSPRVLLLSLRELLLSLRELSSLHHVAGFTDRSLLGNSGSLQKLAYAMTLPSGESFGLGMVASVDAWVVRLSNRCGNRNSITSGGPERTSVSWTAACRATTLTASQSSVGNPSRHHHD